jgi:hypothetical protein
MEAHEARTAVASITQNARLLLPRCSDQVAVKTAVANPLLVG